MYILLYIAFTVVSTDFTVSPPENSPPFASNWTLINSHPVHVSTYHSGQLHFAYKLDGAVSHVVTSLPVAKSDVEYHHPNVEYWSLCGVQSVLILFASTNIIALVHPFGTTFIDGDDR